MTLHVDPWKLMLWALVGVCLGIFLGAALLPTPGL